MLRSCCIHSDIGRPFSSGSDSAECPKLSAHRQVVSHVGVIFHRLIYHSSAGQQRVSLRQSAADTPFVAAAVSWLVHPYDRFKTSRAVPERQVFLKNFSDPWLHGQDTTLIVSEAEGTSQRGEKVVETSPLYIRDVRS